MKRKLFLATALIAVAATAGAGIVFAAGAAWPGGGRGGATAKAVGGGTGSGCGTAFETREDPFYADSFAETPGGPDDLTPASSVSMLKRCAGGAIATFSSETAAEQIIIESQPGTQDIDNNDIQVMVRATCTHHFANNPHSCTVGQTVWAAPGGFGGPVYFDLAPDIYEVHSMQWAFTHLAQGGWRFDVLPVTEADDPNSWLEFRTLLVETL
jgi:hypothetical protein